MVILNTPCVVVKSGGYDLYGQELSGIRKQEKCAVVKLIVTSQHSSVRVDSGATRAAAHELVEDAVLLMSTKTTTGIDDVIEVGSTRLRVRSIRSRYTVVGKLDHLEIGAGIE